MMKTIFIRNNQIGKSPMISAQIKPFGLLIPKDISERILCLNRGKGKKDRIVRIREKLGSLLREY
jgi:hypothetical protein